MDYFGLAKDIAQVHADSIRDQMNSPEMVREITQNTNALIKEGITEIDEFIHAAELAHMDEFKEMAFEMLKHNKDRATVAKSEDHDRHYINIQFSIPKKKKEEIEISSTKWK